MGNSIPGRESELALPKVQSTPSDQGILEGQAGSSKLRDELNGEPFI